VGFEINGLLFLTGRQALAVSIREPSLLMFGRSLKLLSGTLENLVDYLAK